MTIKPIFFLDLDTQKDFLYPDGACSLHGAEKVIPILSRLTHFAKDQRLPLISTACVHEEDKEDFHGLSPHCRRGMDGASKVPESLTLSHHIVENELLDRNMPLLLERYDQLILEKNNFGLFDNPNATRLITCLGGHVFLYGCHEESLRQTMVRLTECGQQVVVVEDACAVQKPTVWRRTLGDLKADGIRTISSRQLFATLSN